MVKTWTHRFPYNEPKIWHHINPRAKSIHYFHRSTNDYEEYIQFCTFELIEIHLKNQFIWKSYEGHQLNANKNKAQTQSSTQLHYVAKVQMKVIQNYILTLNFVNEKIIDITKHTLIYKAKQNLFIFIFKKSLHILEDNAISKQIEILSA